jgi:hypothetical protein
MIAVLAEPGQHRAVREFFELFKTPWEFFHNQSKCSTLICAANQVPANSARLVVLYGSQENSFDRAHGLQIRSRHSGATVLLGENRIPIYGDCLAFGASETGLAVHESTREPVVVTVASDGKTIVRVGFDLFQEIEYLLTRGQPPANAAIPTVELQIALLRGIILGHSVPLIEIPPIPDGHNFIACLTHDMDHIGIRNHRFDHTMLGFLYRATAGSVMDLCRGKKTWRQAVINWFAVLKLPLVHFGLARDFWSQSDRYLEIEKGLNSTFFVIPKKGEPGLDTNGNRPHRRAASYDAADHLQLFGEFKAAGDEISLHGIDAWRDSAAGRQEQEIICRLTGATETGVRMHWLYFNEKSPEVLEAAGFNYDSTVGYNQTIGYRAGTAQVFKPVTTEKLLELPMHVMDTALFYPNYLNLTPARAQEAVRPLIANSSRFGGALTVNWHDRSVAPERLWDAFYEELIEQLRIAGACFLTAGRAVSWFRKRRSVIFEQNGDTVRIRVPGDSDPNLPGLRIRTYSSNTKGESYSDTPLNDGSEVRLAA